MTPTYCRSHVLGTNRFPLQYLAASISNNEFFDATLYSEYVLTLEGCWGKVAHLARD